MASDYPVLIGATGPVEGAPRFVREGGTAGAESTIREWLGYKDDLIALAWGATAPYEISQVSGPVYRLSMTLAGRWDNGVLTTDPNDQVVTVWNLKIQQQRRDLWEHPKALNELLKITDVQGRAQFRRDVTDLCNGEVVSYESDASGTITTVQLTLSAVVDAVVDLWGVDYDIITQLCNEFARGVDGYLYDTFVLSKKRVGPAAATNLIPAFSVINYPVTTAALLAAEPTIPGSMSSPIASQLSGGFWLRNADELNQLNSDQVEVNSQWVFGTSYSEFIYG